MISVYSEYQKIKILGRKPRVIEEDIMSIKSAVKHGISVLSNPDREFSSMKERSFEEILDDYIKFLLVAGLLAGVAAIAYQFGRAAYLDVFKSIAVDYWRLLNYSVGTAVSTFFFYLFAGTFLMFIISLVLKIFVKGLKFTRLLSVMIYSLSPLLVFNWLKDSLFPALFVWSLFLLVKGVKIVKEASATKIRKSARKK